MIIYQVVDEENKLMSEYSQRDVAMHSAEDWTVWHEDHYYHVEEVNFLESGIVSRRD
jgi:hypothetical protein